MVETKTVLQQVQENLTENKWDQGIKLFEKLTNGQGEEKFEELFEVAEKDALVAVPAFLQGYDKGGIAGVEVGFKRQIQVLKSLIGGQLPKQPTEATSGDAANS